MTPSKTPQPPSSQSDGETAHPANRLLGEIVRLVAGHQHDPHAILGAHQHPGGHVTIRALRPLATSVTAVLADGSRYPMPHLHQGVFEASLPATVTTVPDYRLVVSYAGEGDVTERGDGAESPRLQD